ncbi:MAG: OmpA family protein [Proteobacteria bacterium]|nr:OmpA family protein [Pseudomonadota bacterium]MBU4580849.1 OmpA family protein [Pseudomonadota bacterium]MCG2739644.1 OmpA family protein [Syntrophaceae bacterium]
MFQKTPVLAAVVVAFLILGLSGCVAQSDYLRKQAEADALNRDLAARTSQNSDLKAQIDKLTAATEGLIADKDALIADKDGLITDKKRLIADTERFEKERTALEVRLNRITEETSRTIEGLRNHQIELEGDKQMLAESISLLRQTKEVEVRKVSKTYEDLLSEMKNEIAQGQIAITELRGKLTVDVVDRILFDSGQTEIRPEGLGVLKRVVEILMTVTDKVIRVEGHTDSIPIGGALAKRYPTNWELSAARALNVTRFLEKEGIDPALLSAVAFGEHQPIAENDTPEGRARNRRIAIILLPRE